SMLAMSPSTAKAATTNTITRLRMLGFYRVRLSPRVGLLPAGEPIAVALIVRLLRLTPLEVRMLPQPGPHKRHDLVQTFDPVVERQQQNRSVVGGQAARVVRQTLGDLRMCVTDLIAAGGEIEADELATDIGAQSFEVSVADHPRRRLVFRFTVRPGDLIFVHAFYCRTGGRHGEGHLQPD